MSFDWLQEKLTVSCSYDLHSMPIKGKRLIYVMGGNGDDLEIRFRKAAKLFHSGIGQEVMIFIQPGITAFDQALGRNLTNKEWASRQFGHLDMQGDDVIFADFEEGFLGTFTECRNLLEYVRQHGHAHVHIVTSTYHTQRTWLTFFTLSQDEPIFFCVHDAGDTENIRYLIKEYGKLLLYETIFLPLYPFVSS